MIIITEDMWRSFWNYCDFVSKMKTGLLLCIRTSEIVVIGPFLDNEFWKFVYLLPTVQHRLYSSVNFKARVWWRWGGEGGGSEKVIWLIEYPQFLWKNDTLLISLVLLRKQDCLWINNIWRRKLCVWHLKWDRRMSAKQI